MALFGDKKKENQPIKNDKISSATIITSCMRVTGDLDGSDTIHIDGHVFGNITVTNTLVIGQSGIVEGNIEAKNVIINGELKGRIKCDNLEVMQTGKVSKSIEAKHLILDGKIQGDIRGLESIHVLENSYIDAMCIRSKKIVVHGKIDGTVIASQILEIGSKGFVEGQITVKNIKTEEGGRMIGTMSTYEESDERTKIQASPDKTLKPTGNTSKQKIKGKSEKEDDFFKK
jgi:cytoskeletal protein CcmA (bactofilin family)